MPINEVEQGYNSKLEKDIQEFWNKNEIFQNTHF